VSFLFYHILDSVLTTTFVHRKYPEATDYAICSLIGGFFFLRFINPAIVTPQAYMLVEGFPAKHPRRTLTLVSPAELGHLSFDSLEQLDCQDASEPSKQTIIRERSIYDYPQSIRGKQ
jgi:hypothetical protein